MDWRNWKSTTLPESVLLPIEARTRGGTKGRTRDGDATPCDAARQRQAGPPI
jgi:hypothetical protein